MRNKSKKINDALTQISDKYLDTAERMRQPKKKAPWVKWGAAAAAVLLLALGAFALLRGDVRRAGSRAGEDSPSAYRIAAAVYPEMARYSAGGDHEAWFSDIRAQLAGIDAYTGTLDGFLTKSIPALLADGEGENKVCSPLSVYLALAMLAETAGGESREQLLALLDAEDADTLRERAKAVWNANYQDDGATQSVLSASLWLNRDVDFVQSTMDTLARDYYASAYCGEMGSDDLNAALRDWLNANTRGLLANDVSDVGLDEEIIMALFTAVYYHANWYAAFREENSESGVFHAPNGDTSCAFLRESSWNNYYWGERFSAAAKSIETGFRQHTMWFLLPGEGVTPEELLRDPEALRFLLTDKYARNDGQEAWENSAYVTLNLSVPKFDVSAKTDLIGALKTLGVTDIFEAGTADFSPAVKNTAELLPYISKAEHAARLAIDEKGVTAAAYTEFDMRSGGAPAQPEDTVDFVLDRPFVFVLTGADELPLFVGVVNDPAA